MSMTRLEQVRNKRTSITSDQQTSRKLGLLARYEKRSQKLELAFLVEERIRALGGIKKLEAAT